MQYFQISPHYGNLGNPHPLLQYSMLRKEREHGKKRGLLVSVILPLLSSLPWATTSTKAKVSLGKDTRREDVFRA